MSRNFKDLAVSRFWLLFLPLCIWSAILYIIKLSIGYSHFNTDSVFGIFKSIVGGIIYEYWFIWALLYSVFLSNVVQKYAVVRGLSYFQLLLYGLYQRRLFHMYIILRQCIHFLSWGIFFHKIIKYCICSKVTIS